MWDFSRLTQQKRKAKAAAQTMSAPTSIDVVDEAAATEGDEELYFQDEPIVPDDFDELKQILPKPS
jgi:hypothetical protein